MLIHVEDTLPGLTGQIRLNGSPFNLSAGTTSIAVKLVGPGDVVIDGAASKGAGTQGNVSYAWQAGDTDVAGVYYGSWIVTTASGTFTQPGIDVVIYDPDVLWANTAAVEAIIGPQSDVEPVVGALVQAQQAIEAWVTREIPDPVPDRVRRAHAIMAARVVTGPQFGPGGSAGVIQESIGDHSVRYARPQEAAAVLDPSMHPEVVKLLKPWAPTNYTSTTTDEAGGTGASRSAEERLPASQVDYTSSVTVSSALDDLYTQVGQPGVTDHGALTGIGDDDHLLYEPTTSTLNVSGSITVTTQTRVLMASGGSVTLPNAASRAGGRTLTVLSSGGAVTVTAAGGDNVFNPGQTVLKMSQGSVVRLAPVDLSVVAPGLWVWAVIDGYGSAFDLPAFYNPATGDPTATQGHVIKMGATAPEWGAVPAPSASDITSGTLAYGRLPVGTTSNTVAAGNDARLSRPPSLLVSGQYTSGSSVSTGNAGVTANRLYYQPIYVPRTVTVDRIAVNHAATTAGAGSVMRLGIYTSTNDLPSTLLLDAGTVDLTTAAALKTVTINQQLTAGVYWLAAVGQITSGSPTFATGNPGMHVPDAGGTFTGVKFEGGVTGSLPATATPGTSNTTQPPLIYLRIV